MFEGDSTCSGVGKEVVVVPDTYYGLPDDGGFIFSRDVARCANGGEAWWTSYRDKSCTNHWIDKYNSTYISKSTCRNSSDPLWSFKKGAVFSCKGILERMSDETKRKIGLGVGIGGGLFILLAVVVCIYARRRWRKAAPVDRSRPGLMSPAKPRPTLYK